MATVLMYFAAVSANLGILACGLFFGWSSPAFPLYEQNDYGIKLKPSEESLIAALLPIGGTIGCILSVFLTNKIGRKYTMLATVIPIIASWLLIAFATKFWMLALSRLLAGISTGAGYCATPMYLGEISPASIRGVVLTGIQVAEKTGIFIEYSYGPFLSIKNGALVSLIFPILFALTFVWLPESPYYYLIKHDSIKAEKSLSKFHGKKNIAKELEIIEKSIDRENSNKESSFTEIFTVPVNRRALAISLTVIVIQQFTGTQAIISYASSIFDVGNTPIEGKYLTIMLGGVTLFCTIICAILVDRHGRRKLLIVSSSGVCLSMALLATYFHIKYYDSNITSSFNWIPAAGVILFSIFYAIGLNALPFTLLGELFSTNVKALGCSIAIVTVSIVCAFVTFTFPIIRDTFGIHIAFWLYSASSFFGSFYIYYSVPNTTGKSLEEIQETLHRNNTKSI